MSRPEVRSCVAPAVLAIAGLVAFAPGALEPHRGDGSALLTGLQPERSEISQVRRWIEPGVWVEPSPPGGAPDDRPGDPEPGDDDYRSECVEPQTGEHVGHGDTVGYYADDGGLIYVWICLHGQLEPVDDSGEYA